MNEQYPHQYQFYPNQPTPTNHQSKGTFTRPSENKPPEQGGSKTKSVSPKKNTSTSDDADFVVQRSNLNDTGRKRGRGGSQAGRGKKARIEPKGGPVNRKDNSLNRLTARFMDMISTSANGIVDLNNASAQLQVQKRRIYDITNVLEGIGLIEKKSKNNIVWSGGNISSNDALDQLEQLREEISEMNNTEMLLDQELKDRQGELKRILEDQPDTAFVTHDDIRELPGMDDQTIIAVRAQTGTRLEVPDPDYGGFPGRRRRYQIFLKSDHPIDVYLVSQMDEELREGEAEQFQQQRPSIYDSYSQPTPPVTAPPVDMNPGLLRPPDLPIEYYFSQTEGGGSISDFYNDEPV